MAAGSHQPHGTGADVPDRARLSAVIGAGEFAAVRHTSDGGTLDAGHPAFAPRASPRSRIARARAGDCATSEFGARAWGSRSGPFGRPKETAGDRPRADGGAAVAAARRTGGWRQSDAGTRDWRAFARAGCRGHFSP